MIKLTELLNETYKNFIGTDDDTLEKKRKWADEVWDMLQRSYKKLGGIKGSGFNSKEDMIKNIPFWKLYLKSGELKMVVMYKDKGGRKLVAMGTDGSDHAKDVLANNLTHEMKRSFGEKSGPSLGFTMKKVPFEIIQQFLLTPEEAQQVLGRDKEVIPAEKYGISNLNSKDQKAWKAFKDKLRPYFYVREVGDGIPLMKVMIGTPNMTIK